MYVYKCMYIYINACMYLLASGCGLLAASLQRADIGAVVFAYKMALKTLCPNSSAQQSLFRIDPMMQDKCIILSSVGRLYVVVTKTSSESKIQRKKH